MATPGAGLTPEADEALVRRAWEALEDVRDPELDVSLVGLGLIRGVHVEGGRACVQLTFTSMGCPWTDVIRESIRERLLALPGIASLAIEDVWDRPWTPRDLRPDARSRLQDIGIATP